MITKKQIKLTEEYLNSRYDIFKSFGERPADNFYYLGAIAMVEQMGLTWERDEKGNHKIFQ